MGPPEIIPREACTREAARCAAAFAASALMLDDVLKATLSDLQKTSKYFRGFTDEDIDAFAPFLVRTN